MKVIVAPNAFKGCLTATQAAGAMARGVLAAEPGCTIVKIPIADGGDGLVRVLNLALKGEIRVVGVTGPRGAPTKAEFLWLDDSSTAVLEVAKASGLALLEKAQQNPTLTNTKGVGELVAAALEQGARHILIGIGGSATCDGGVGMAFALGVRFYDVDGTQVDPVGGDLTKIDRIDMSGLNSMLKQVKIEVACDVDNPLLGSRGAARIYAPQKGADENEVELLEKGLDHLSKLFKRDLGIDVTALPGGGAAGGLGAGLYSFLDAELRSGVDMVLDLVGISKVLTNADLVLTGEGAMDEQTLSGKAPIGVAAKAKAAGVPCIAIAGSVSNRIGDLHEAGVTAMFSLCNGPSTLEDTMMHSNALLESAAEQAVRAFSGGRIKQ